MPRILIVAVMVLALNAPATAYNKAAHMVSGAIAYHALKVDSPQTLEKILALLNQHPDRDKFKLGAVSAEDRAQQPCVAKLAMSNAKLLKKGFMATLYVNYYLVKVQNLRVRI